jgi:hypothetical protein
MNLKKTIAGGTLAAALLLAGAGTAFATEPPPGRPPASAECKAAARTLHELRVLDARLRAEYGRVVRLRNAAAKAGKTEAVKKLDAQLAKMRVAHAKVVAKVKVAAAKAREECAAAPTAA